MKYVPHSSFAVGEVIFLPAIYRDKFSRKGYISLGEKRLTVEDEKMGMEIDAEAKFIWKCAFEKVTSLSH